MPIRFGSPEANTIREEDRRHEHLYRVADYIVEECDGDIISAIKGARQAYFEAGGRGGQMWIGDHACTWAQLADVVEILEARALHEQAQEE